MSKSDLWCVGVRPEGDSPHEQLPAMSKELAERAVERYRAMTKAEGNQFLIETFDDWCQVQRWHGTRREHMRKMFYNDAWFKAPMYQCHNMVQAEKAFKYGELVHCYNGTAELITADFNKAKEFYGVQG